MGFANKVFDALHSWYKPNSSVGRALSALRDKTQQREQNRHLSLFGGSAWYKNSGYRGDKDAQEDIRRDVEAGRNIHFSSPQSERYYLGKDKSTIYDSNRIAEIDKENPDLIEKDLKNTHVASTAIDSFDYNPKTEKLDVRFTSNPTSYTFPDVPSEVITEWMEAPSKGKYYNAVIKEYSTNK